MTDKIFYNFNLKIWLLCQKNIIKPMMHSHIEHVQILSLILLNCFDYDCAVETTFFIRILHPCQCDPLFFSPKCLLVPQLLDNCMMENDDKLTQGISILISENNVFQDMYDNEFLRC